MSEVNVSASNVRDLREKTGAGMMECKKALMETKGDFEAAVDLLRKKGLSVAAKKAGRVTSEGLTSVKTEKTLGVLLEVNSETDFVARSSQFQQLVRDITDLALEVQDIEELKDSKLSSGRTVSEEIIENIATIGENLTLRRMDKLEISNGVIGTYVHNTVAANLGKISVLVGVESDAKDTDRLQKLAHQLAIHVAGNNPQSLDEASLDKSLVEKERKIFFEQSKAAGKSDEIINKMVDGRIRKFLSEVVLLQQNFLFDPKLLVSQVIEETSKELGAPIKITKFIRYELGEGVKQEEQNFAKEVAAVLKG